MARRTKPFPRYLATRLREALADTPAVLIHGPRQSGKTTLARTVGQPRGYHYVSFDDEAIRDAARRDPVGFVEGLPRRTILDEVQRVPELFTSLKAAIDERRTAGRFILTGSANVLLVPTLADSLAGRMGILRLHPLAQCELQGKRPRFIDTLFRGGFRTRLTDRLRTALAERIVGGGYPAALVKRTPARRRAFEVDIVLERGSAAVAGIEVKAAASVNDADFRGLRKLREAAGRRFAAGVLLYDGTAATPFGDDLFAVPFRSLWEDS